MELTISEKIKVLRERADLTQEQLAALVGVSQAFLSAVEGGTREPRLETLRKIAGVLGCQVDIVENNNKVTTL